jgi:hypothetical protein
MDTCLSGVGEQAGAARCRGVDGRSVAVLFAEQRE